MEVIAFRHLIKRMEGQLTTINGKLGDRERERFIRNPAAEKHFIDIYGFYPRTYQCLTESQIGKVNAFVEGMEFVQREVIVRERTLIPPVFIKGTSQINLSPGAVNDGYQREELVQEAIRFHREMTSASFLRRLKYLVCRK